jgi:hypothetical protein
MHDEMIIIGDNGTLTFWDYATGTPFQNMEDIPQPGSLEAEAGVFCSTFDQTGTRLITGGADKTIKVCQLFFFLSCLTLTSGRYMPSNRNKPVLTCTIVVLPVLFIRYLPLSSPYYLHPRHIICIICLLSVRRNPGTLGTLRNPFGFALTKFQMPSSQSD